MPRRSIVEKRESEGAVRGTGGETMTHLKMRNLRDDGEEHANDDHWVQRRKGCPGRGVQQEWGDDDGKVHWGGNQVLPCRHASNSVHGAPEDCALEDQEDGMHDGFLHRDQGKPTQPARVRCSLHTDVAVSFRVVRAEVAKIDVVVRVVGVAVVRDDVLRSPAHDQVTAKTQVRAGVGRRRQAAGMRCRDFKVRI